MTTNNSKFCSRCAICPTLTSDGIECAHSLKEVSEEILTKPEIQKMLGEKAHIDYERNYSHYHCWDQSKPPACGQKLEDHKQCCLCDTPTPTTDSWEEELIVEVMEDYIAVVEDTHTGTYVDKVGRRRECFEKLKSFIRTEKEKSYKEAKDELNESNQEYIKGLLKDEVADFKQRVRERITEYRDEFPEDSSPLNKALSIIQELG
jgi:hypothetical protein